MKLVIETIPFIYGRLIDPPVVIFREEPESWKGEREDNLEGIKNQYRFGGRSLPLPEPLHLAGMFFGREGPDNYSGGIYFKARDPSPFSNISEDLKKRFNGKFFATSPHGTGYVLDDRGKPAVSIADLGEGGAVRQICIGCSGAYLRKLTDDANFGLDVRNLEKVANEFLNVCFLPLVTAGKLELPEINLSLIC